MNTIRLLNNGRFLSKHSGATVYFDSKHRIIKSQLEGGIEATLIQERQADDSYQYQLITIANEVIRER